MTRKSQRVLTAVVLLPIAAFWLLVSPYAVDYVLHPPQPPYDQPSLLPGLLMLGSGCSGVAFLGLAVLLYFVRRRDRNTNGQ